MSVIILPNRFKRQPPYAAPIDYSGLAKGLRILWNPAAGPVDIVTGRIWAPRGNAAMTTAPDGRVFSFDGVDDHYSHTGYPEITGNTGSFFVWCPTVGVADTYGHVLFGASSPVAFAHQINPAMQVHIGSSPASNGTLPSWFNTRNRSLVLASGGRAETTRAFLDGKNSGLTWAGAPVAWGAGNKNFNLGRYVGGTSWDFSGTILLAGYTDAVWGEAESRAFHENPWQLLKARTKKLWAVGETTGNLTTAISTQKNAISTAVIAQDQVLVIAPGVLAHTLSTGAVTAELALVNLPGDQANISGTSAITQAHVLGAGALTQKEIASASAITQAHILIATARAQENTSSSVVLHIRRNLASASFTQANAGGKGTVAQTHIIIAGESSQVNRASIGKISNGVVVETALVSGIAKALHIKKPGIPHGTPEWLKTMIETLTGRRGNRIAVPKFKALEFSATPTREECEALYQYTNTVRDSLEQLITRMDS